MARREYAIWQGTTPRLSPGNGRMNSP
jgi:hypothetical protein